MVEVTFCEENYMMLKYLKLFQCLNMLSEFLNGLCMVIKTAAADIKEY